MRPVLMPSSFPPHVGGVELVAGRLATGLCRSGHSPLVLTNRWPKTLPAAEVIAGVPVRREVLRVPEPTVRQLGGWLLTGAAIRARMRGAAAEHGAGVINVHCVSSNAGYALHVATRLSLPLVVSLHGELSGDASDVYRRSSLLRRQWRRLIDRAAVVTAPSLYCLQQAETVYGQPFGARGQVIRNAVDHDVFAAPAAPGPRSGVLAVGRLVGVKGFDTLLDSWARVPAALRRRHPLVIAGEGPQRAALTRQVARLRLQGEVRLVGENSQHQVADRMRRSALVVVPSRHEALGLVAMEALTAGASIVATRVGGLQEVITSAGVGALVEADDPPQLAEAMERALLLADAGGPAANAATPRLPAPTWDELTAQFVRCYQQAMETGL